MLWRRPFNGENKGIEGKRAFMCIQLAAWTRTRSRFPPPPGPSCRCPPASTTAAVPSEACRGDGCWALWSFAMLVTLKWLWLFLCDCPLVLDFRRSCLTHPASKRKARGSTRPTVFMAMDLSKSTTATTTIMHQCNRLQQVRKKQKQQSLNQPGHRSWGALCGRLETAVRGEFACLRIAQGVSVLCFHSLTFSIYKPNEPRIVRLTLVLSRERGEKQKTLKRRSRRWSCDARANRSQSTDNPDARRRGAMGVNTAPIMRRETLSGTKQSPRARGTARLSCVSDLRLSLVGS